MSEIPSPGNEKQVQTGEKKQIIDQISAIGSLHRYTLYPDSKQSLEVTKRLANAFGVSNQQAEQAFEYMRNAPTDTSLGLEASAYGPDDELAQGFWYKILQYAFHQAPQDLAPEKRSGLVSLLADSMGIRSRYLKNHIEEHGGEPNRDMLGTGIDSNIPEVIKIIQGFFDGKAPHSYSELVTLCQFYEDSLRKAKQQPENQNQESLN